MSNITKSMRKIAAGIPLWSSEINYPRGLSIIKTKKQITNNKVNNTIVYFPSCISRVLGSYNGKQKNIMETFMSVCTKANIDVIVLENAAGSCCNQIFSSKGFKGAYQFTQTISSKNYGKTESHFPVVIDVSSGAYTLHNMRPVL